VCGPEFEGPALLVHVLVKVIGLVADALRLVVLHSVADFP
jgi:hypothetical protein